MTKKSHPQRSRSWVQQSLKVYWAVMAALALLMLGQYIVSQPPVLAGTNATNNATNTTNVTNSTNGSNQDPWQDTSGSLTQLPFDEYFCQVVLPYGQGIITALAIVMILAAGVMYILSFGSNSGEIGGINTAKAMILAAITGLMLNLMGSLLLGDCGFNLGGLIGKLFPQG